MIFLKTLTLKSTVALGDDEVLCCSDAYAGGGGGEWKIRDCGRKWSALACL
jgi:hypothetical protein